MRVVINRHIAFITINGGSSIYTDEKKGDTFENISRAEVAAEDFNHNA